MIKTAYSPLKKIKHRRSEPNLASLNLTSMMDIFTILLLFLLKSFSSEGQIVTIADNLELPVSTSTQKPKLTLNLIITKEAIIVEGREVERLANIVNSKELLINNLMNELKLHSKRSKYIATINKSIEFRGDITIQADKSIPFKLIKRIMYTCGQAEFSNISLAVFAND